MSKPPSATIAILLVSLLGLVACAKETPNGNEAGLGPTATDANGWQEIHLLHTNSTDIHLGNGAHYHIERNACFVDAWGAVELADWNILVAAANRAIAAPALEADDEYCVNQPQAWPYVNGDVVIDIGVDSANVQKRTLFTGRGNMICSTISDQEASDTLLAQLHKLVKVADKKDCNRP